jgi:virginiamycin B lyase
MLTEFPLPHATSQPRFIVAGRDGNLWFTENSRIGRITPQGAITEFRLPADTTPPGLAVGADGTVWFTTSSPWIGRLNPRNGVITQFSLPAGSPPAYPIVAGPDGNLWFGAGRSPGGSVAMPSEVGRITPKGTITVFPLTGHTAPVNMAIGRDGNIWFTTLYGLGIDSIGRITPQGTLTWFPLPDLDEEPMWITAGPDDSLWFTRPYAVVGRITAQGAITEFPPFDSGAFDGLAVGSDGNLWLTDPPSLWRVTPTGTVKEYPLPPGVRLYDITTGSDGAFWATDIVDNAIVRVELARSD